MSDPVTEIAYVPLNPSISLDSGEGKEIWQSTLQTIASQEGFKRLYWGTQIENPSIAQMAIGTFAPPPKHSNPLTQTDWTSLEAHKAFIASPAYGPFLDRLAPLLATSPHIFHIRLPTPSQESGTPPFNAPVTECISLYFAPSASESAYNANFSAFVAEAGKVPGAGATGLVGGWGVETHRVDDGEGEEKKLFGAFVGWPSLESHMEFREKEEFARVVGHLREGVEKVKVHHVAFTEFEA